ncbi:hypothetical protein V1514DRAFT_361865 [Lipomyces japonicus]|uniref:uncharacterized protein n=1 Tax=Lipomyces japonicus TaxID=56871 RepID=UPI0034CD250F
MQGRQFFLSACFFVLFAVAKAHDHDDSEIPEGEYITVEPLDSVLWAHIFMMMLAFGFFFPVGMILGLTKSRYHVPCQVAGAVFTIVGYFLGHHHKGREFPSHNIHSVFAPILFFVLSFQVAIGAYLKLHWEKGIHKHIRRFIVIAHGVAGKVMPILSWVQMGFGGITALGFCHGDHLGQCLAHGIMGSAFIAYGCIMLIAVLCGQAWLARSGRSQEFYDSLVITLWGIVNTFTEHRWGQPWSHGDYQHTSMGIVWWCAGMLGIFLSKSNGRPRRNIVPALVIVLTGWAMSVHAQHLEISTKIHAMFGYALMGAGFARLIEISFLLNDEAPAGEPKSFQYLSPFLLVASGFLFMFANEEQLDLISQNMIDHSSYTLIIYSVSFLYEVANDSASTSSYNAPNSDDLEAEQRLRDVQEYELNGLLRDSR